MSVDAENRLDTATETGTRRLTIYYTAALSTVALLAVIGQWLVRSQLSLQLNDSKVVNLAGRQRMLSQRLCKYAALLEMDLGRENRDRQLAELRDLLPVWRRAQLGLQQGDTELGLPANESRAAAEIFVRIQPTFEAMHAAAERLVADPTTGIPLQSASSGRKGDLAALLDREAVYLAGMDEIVSHYERESHERVARLLRLERVLLVLTLIVLLAEGVFVFRPAARQIAASISALRSAGEKLRVAKDAAESASRVKTEFLAKISHELRTPLHAIFGATELLRASNPQLAGADYADVVDDSSRMLLWLLNDLLDLSKIEADKIELHQQPFDLREFAARTISMFRSDAQAKCLDLQLRIDAKVPEVVVADALRLRQVLANLLNNAIKFTDAGSVVMSIATPKHFDGRDAIHFEVADTGIGIRAEDQVRVFESFTQLSIDADKSPGAGLGLAISSRLVALMGGKLAVTSELGRGSSFQFALSGLPTTPAADPTSAWVDGTRRERSLEVLAAEDAPLGRRILEELLLMFGHHVECVAGGEEAVAAFKRRRFDIVLLDLRMPGMDGRVAAAAIRQVEQTQDRLRTPIVALSADAYSPPIADHGLGDFDDFVTKPFSGEQLRVMLGRNVIECGRRCSDEVNTFSSVNEEAAGTTFGDLRLRRAAAILSRLRGNRELLDELIGLFLAGATQILDELQGLARVSNFADLHTAAHRLRGQLASFEEDRASAIACRLEDACVRADAEAVGRELTLLSTAWPNVCSEIELLRSTMLESYALHLNDE